MQAQSAAITDIEYETEHGKLFVRFADGDRYVYVGVPGEVHRSFLQAHSKGGFFAEEIRDVYPWNRLEPWNG
ncbi:MAG: KTSC domain-containing protein [Caulobacter sp.]|nr:KTSC domain-containing protein [Caulobacter sp.]